MKKQKYFEGLKFPVEALKEAIEAVKSIGDGQVSEGHTEDMRVSTDNVTWYHDDLNEFFADYRAHNSRGALTHEQKVRTQSGNQTTTLSIDMYADSTSVAVRSANRSDIESVMGVFESWAPRAEIIESGSMDETPTVFIGHGGNPIWRELRDHLRDQHGIRVEAYESGSRAGHSIRDILDDMVDKSSFALLVLTGEDFMPDQATRARQNVVHETGLFQGRLGFARAIALVEDGVELFSNMDGIQQIRFSKSKIRETYGDVLATIRREFGPKK